MSNDQSQPVRKVVPYKPGRRIPTVRKLNPTFAGTAIEQALAEREAAETTDQPDRLDLTSSQPGHTSQTFEAGQTSETRQTTVTTPPSQTSRAPYLPDSTGAETALTDQTAIEADPTRSISPPTQTSQTTTTSQPGDSSPSTVVRSGAPSPFRPARVTSQHRDGSEIPIAPARDFSRVPNSITREAIPAGVFRGKSKQLYDCLYWMTRGAVVPTRAVRIHGRN